MVNSSRRSGRDPLSLASALREAAADRRPCPEASCEDMPMRHYYQPNSIPCAHTASCPGQEIAALLEQLAEQSCNQNQLLTDLLGAVNSLTAALLAKQCQI